MYFLGIDTSCYTTSVAAVDENGILQYDGRILLEVPLGGRGLRQADAVFQHVNNIGRLFEECFGTLGHGGLAAVAASSKPRKAENSYMPVFTVGLNAGKIIASGTGIRLYEVSHQENHILAGEWSAGQHFDGDFLAYHISGGTTELLYVHNSEDMRLESIGGSSDLKAGQFIDRVGVSLGMKFPCGQEMDSLCKNSTIADLNVPVPVDGCYTSFSGPESHIQRLIRDSGADAASVCHAAFISIAKAIEKTAVNASEKYSVRDLLLVGGVTANSIIREYISNSGQFKKHGLRAVFSGGRYSSDNAVGTALYGRKSYDILRRNK